MVGWLNKRPDYCDRGHWEFHCELPGLDTAAEHREHALAAGFEDIRIEDRSREFRRSLRRLYTMTAASFPLARIGHALGIRSRVQHGNVVGSLRAWQSLVRGTWFYATVTATRSATRLPPGDTGPTA